ncbi:MAG: YkgJ family cysteine cluster protein [Verrucomicrobiaceae bacterium]|nr:YkgJ family cysteine cluster protein [Verrucomicrobiaceae bacterium]
MNFLEDAAAASRLCAACGMCCDGTMFQIVRMQTGDSPAALMRLGMRIRRKGGEFLMEQPCAGLCERRCTIYESRPARCRAFFCQQLRLLEEKAITEAEALTKIEHTRGLAERVRALIAQSGHREDGTPLQEQYDRVTAVRVDPNWEPEQVEVRDELESTMQELKVILRRDFMPPPCSR